jgi:YbbR domain-containing protein
MAGIGKRLKNNAGLKALALLAALALWVLISAGDPPQEIVEAGVAEADVAVEPVWSGAEAGEFVIEEFTVIPAALKIAGPAESVALVQRLATQPIDVSAITANGAVEAAVILPDPKLRFVDNPTVRVEVKVRRR